MEKIRHYELVNPMEVVTFHHILKLEESFINNGAVPLDLDHFLEVFNNSFSNLLKEMREEPVEQIKEELKVDKIDLDGIIQQERDYSPIMDVGMALNPTA